MDITKLANAVTQKDYSLALDVLFQLLNQIEAGQDFVQPYTINRVTDEIKASYTEFATLITELFIANACRPSINQYYALNLHKHKLAAIFEVSDYQNTDHLLLPIKKQLDKKSKINKQSHPLLMKLLLLYNFSNDMKVDIWRYLQKAPELGIDAAISLLSAKRVITREEQSRYRNFLKNFKLLSDWQCHNHSIPLLARAWYQMAYDMGTYKYTILSLLNHLMSAWLKKIACVAQAKQAISPKPIILVILEHFRSDHAVYRCFANGIKSLARHYTLVALAEPSEMDQVSKAHFQQCIDVVFQVPTDIKNIVATVNEIKPDVCLYLSVGMKSWVIALANLRLAPLQFVTAGHPISTCSKVIDYMLLEDHKFLPDIYFQEKVLGLPSGNFGFVLPEHKRLSPEPKSSEVIRIALSASVYKLTPDFLAVCKTIAARTQQTVEFHSFSACRGLTYHQLNTKLRYWLPSIKVYPMCSYSDYLNYLAGCDMYLAPFPFGGTNSTVDCALLGLPMVALEMADLACSDSFIMKKLGLNDYVANNIDNYIALALQLIEDRSRRHAVIEQLTELDDSLNGLLGGEERGDPYVVCINSAIQHHQNHTPLQESFTASQDLLTNRG